MKAKPCELCPSAATVFCPSDAAFLCRTCDAKIHDANFLVARHLRQSICPTFSQGVTGVGLRPSAAASSTTDADSSSTISSGKRRRPYKSSPAVDNFKAEGIFVNWCGKLGMEVELAVKMACKGLRLCLDRWTVLPFRVCLAASMWLGLKLSLEKSVLTCKLLKRLEQISGVPAKLILAAVSKLERALTLSKEHDHRRTLDLEEGWAES